MVLSRGKLPRRADASNDRLLVVADVGVVAAFVAAIVGGGSLLCECGEREEVSTPQRAFHASASPDQRCKVSDRLDAKQSPSRWLCSPSDDLNRLLL